MRPAFQHTNTTPETPAARRTAAAPASQSDRDRIEQAVALRRTARERRLDQLAAAVRDGELTLRAALDHAALRGHVDAVHALRERGDL